MNEYQSIVENCGIEIKKCDSSILARVAVDLKTPPIIIKGLTIKSSNAGAIFASPPSYHNRHGGNSPIIWMPKELWQMLSERIIKEYEGADLGTGNAIDINDPMFANL